MEISILGCGWLGLPLAETLLQKGHVVKGSTAGRSKLALIRNKGIQAYFVKLSPELSGGDLSGFFASEIMIISFPTKRIENIVDFHGSQIKSLIAQIKKTAVRKVIFVSSTAVYPNLNREVREADAVNPEKESGKALLLAEKLLMQNPHFETTVLRFGGLIGKNRNPVNFLGAKTRSTSPNVPVNLIHIDDCVHIITRIIEKSKWGAIYNACCPEHPLREKFYEAAAKSAGMEYASPHSSNKFKYKTVNSDKLIKELGYKFTYPDPLQIF